MPSAAPTASATASRSPVTIATCRMPARRSAAASSPASAPGRVGEKTAPARRPSTPTRTRDRPRRLRGRARAGYGRRTVIAPAAEPAGAPDRDPCPSTSPRSLSPAVPRPPSGKRAPARAARRRGGRFRERVHRELVKRGGEAPDLIRSMPSRQTTRSISAVPASTFPSCRAAPSHAAELLDHAGPFQITPACAARETPGRSAIGAAISAGTGWQRRTPTAHGPGRPEPPTPRAATSPSPAGTRAHTGQRGARTEPAGFPPHARA